jgi:hypothetical protein
MREHRNAMRVMGDAEGGGGRGRETLGKGLSDPLTPVHWEQYIEGVT